MYGRAASPATSISGFDISGNLLGGGSDDDAFEATSRIDHSAQIANAADLEAAGSDSDDAEFIAATQAASNRKISNVKGRSVKKGGGFQAMGLNSNLLKAITRKGFSVPTPIQRKTIPLLLDGQDVVGMARTGSGKTAAFVIPMIEKLKAHSAKVGARALIMSPSRELALQTLKVVKELGKGTDLRSVLLVGGDSLEEQFGLMAGNPDIVIATPGRFLHLKVEMSLDLSSIQYVVFDEADRLFEMGFAAQLTEILHGLPQARQTLLFSATLPKSLVEFARAGLQEPNLVRLDTEGKISPDLQSAFFTVKTADKDGALLYILHEVIKVPTGETEAAQAFRESRESKATGSNKRKRGRDGAGSRNGPTKHSTIIFTATKHHVEYIANLLRLSGFSVSHLYGSLDQTARNMQVQDFRTGMTNVLVVTDVAARGVDIPVLANVINYDFPPQPKIYIHRVGRTARAGQQGWSYSLVRNSDCPYLLDLQLFLGRRIVMGRKASSFDFAQDVVVGSLPRDKVERHCEWVIKVLDDDIDILTLKEVAGKGEKLFMRTRNPASSESAKRAKSISSSEEWQELHALFQDEADVAEIQREKMLAQISGFRPSETIFELNKRGAQEEAGEVVKKRREAIQRKKLKQEAQSPNKAKEASDDSADDDDDEDEELTSGFGKDNVSDDGEDVGGVEIDADMESASDSELEVTFSNTATSTKKRKDRNSDGGNFQDAEHFMAYTPASTNLYEERGYGVHTGGTSSGPASFIQGAKDATMDLGADEGGAGFAEANGKRWDKRHKKYVSRANDEDGSKGARLVRGESGVKIAASFRSGRFDEWRKRNRVDKLPRVGEAESSRPLMIRTRHAAASNGPPGSAKRWRHTQDKAPKAADKFRDDYFKKRKKIEAAKQRGTDTAGANKKSDLKSNADIRKARIAKEKRREKTGRPSKKGKR